LSRVEILPVLVEISGDTPGREFSLAPGEHTLGRDVEVSIRLDHPDVSRRHARLQVTPEAVTISDLGSKNGVWIDGRSVSDERPLRHGERLEIGALVLELRHPGARVSQVLAAGGEATVTRRRPTKQPPAGEKPGIALPLTAAALFALAMVALMLWG
jgi:pSer/pThr/pTyr-binding forkhead associated (FHA) protein